MKYSASDLARIVGEKFNPTDEQIKVIESPLAPGIVIAGAGSGKTTVVAARVLYLIANELVPADAILGLTFTRKAAGELAHRVRENVKRFRRYQAQEAAGTQQRSQLELAAPNVQTYNSYAASLVNEYGLRIGMDSSTTVLDDAAAGLLADSVLNTLSTEEVLPDKSRTAMVENLLKFVSQKDEHLRTSQEVRDYLTACINTFLQPTNLREWIKKFASTSYSKDERQLVKDQLLAAVDAQADKPVSLWDPQERQEILKTLLDYGIVPELNALTDKMKLIGLADAFTAAKAETGQMQFSDQVARAYTIVTAAPEVVAAERSKWKVVLLDEYQDTSDSQFRLLSTLFGGTPVMAVGDPRQSIYGWRGASARNIEEFPQAFAPGNPDFTVMSLRTSWRNSAQVLAVANEIARHLPGYDPATELTASASALSGNVELRATPGFADPEYGLDQYRELVDWLGQRSGHRAVLCRKRAQFPDIANALAAAGIPYQIAGGVGGLDDPFVADVFATLNVIADPSASDHLMRLLTGRQCALGAADVRNFNRLVRARNRRMAQVLGDEYVDSHPITAVEVIDELLESDARNAAGMQDDIQHSRLSATAVERLESLGRKLRTLRHQQSTLYNQVHRTSQVLDIRAEINALPAISARAHEMALDAFHSSISNFLAANPGARLGDMLLWLTLAESAAALETPEEALDPSAVTIMTVHASKGLEFDAVAVPHLSKRDMPTTLRSARAWLSLAELPYPLRGDASKLPDFDFTSGRVPISSKKELKDWNSETLRPALELHHETEERRVAYVAITRAKEHLFLSASWYSTRTKPNELSPFFLNAADALQVELTLPEEPAEKPESRTIAIPWPAPAAPEVAEYRESVLAALAQRTPGSLHELAMRDDTVGVYARRAEHLLSREPDRAEELPRRLSATNLVALNRDPEEFLMFHRRPMPTPPSTALALGTAFHAWVEKFYGQASLGDLEEAENRRSLPTGVRETLDRLAETFQQSRYAQLTPDAVELPFELSIDNHRVPGKIDAVFIDGDTVTVVDWKTSRKPDADTLAAMNVQLAIYVQAVAQMERYRGKDIAAEFYFLGSDEIVTLDPQVEVPSLAEVIACVTS